MTKGAFFAKLETFQTLVSSGLLTLEGLKDTVQKSLSSKELRAFREDVFADKPVEMLEFARSIGLVKAAGQRSPAIGGRDSGIGKLVEVQYPDYYNQLKPAIEMSSTQFEVVTPSGEKVKVAFQPFWRHIKPKKEKVVTSGSTTQGEAVI